MSVSQFVRQTTDALKGEKLHLCHWQQTQNIFLKIWQAKCSSFRRCGFDSEVPGVHEDMQTVDLSYKICIYFLVTASPKSEWTGLKQTYL